MTRRPAILSSGFAGGINFDERVYLWLAVGLAVNAVILFGWVRPRLIRSYRAILLDSLTRQHGAREKGEERS
jgi:hypothetical protein